MRNSKFNCIFCICAFLSHWLLSGAEEKCVGEVLEFPGVENHRFTVPETKWLNFSFTVRDEACVTAKPFDIRVYRVSQPLCILTTAWGKCKVTTGNACGCSGRAMQFTFSKKMEADDAKIWRWSVRHGLDEIDHCLVTFGLNPSKEPIVNSNSSEYCLNRVSTTRNIIASALPDISTHMQAKSTSHVKTDVHRDEEQEIVLRASSENLTAVLGETKHVDFLVPAYMSWIENCMLSKISHNAGGGLDSVTAPANHTCAVELEIQNENDQRGEKSHTIRPTGLKCVCKMFPGKDVNRSLTLYLFDSRVTDSGRWSVRVNNTHGRGHAEFTLIVTDNTYAVRQPEVDSSLPTIMIILAVVGVAVGIVSFLCWKRKTKAEPQEPQYSSIPVINSSLVIRKLPSVSSTSSITNLSNQTQSSRLFSKSLEETRNRQIEGQVQETNAPTNVVCEMNCSNEPVILDTGVKMSCSAVDMKLVLYIKGCPVNPDTSPVASPTSAEPEYLNPCSPMYVTMDTVEKRNRPQTYQNDMVGDRYMSMSPPRYCSMPRSMKENAGVDGGVSSDPLMNFCNTNYDMNEENYDTKMLHLNCISAYEKKIAEVSELEKKSADISEFQKNIAEVSEYSVIS